MVVHQECLNDQVIAYYEEKSKRNYIRLIGWLNGLFSMDIKQQHHHHQHLATTTSMYYFNTDLVEDVDYGDVDGDGGWNVFQSDDLDDGYRHLQPKKNGYCFGYWLKKQ